MTNRKFYSASVCQPGEDYCKENFDRIVSKSSFVLHEDTKQPGVYDQISMRDILLLKYNNLFVAYGEVTKRYESKDDYWNQWADVTAWIFFDNENKEEGVSTYGIGGSTNAGGQYGTVKELENNFAMEKVRAINSSVPLFIQLINEISNQKSMTDLNEKIALLKFKHQIILQGPPGTGKTRLAELLADELIKPNVIGNPIEIINGFFSNYDPNNTQAILSKEDSKKLLDNFHQAFPIERLKNLTLDDYCAGKGDRNNFCWWIETGLKALGKYSPGSSRSYLIYWSKDDNDYRKCKLLEDVNRNEEAMKKISELIYKVVKSKKTDEALEYFGDSFLLKILNSYFPSEYFPINGKSALDNALQLFGINANNLNKFEKNKKLNDLFNEKKREYKSDITSFEFMRFLFDNFNLKSGEEINTSKTVVTKGEKALIQFHPAYSYEDFVRGIVAGTNDKGYITYSVENKILAEFAQKAKDNPNGNYVLIIDEINRANLPAVLGELIYALEYRNKSVVSVYEYEGEREIILPKNLFVIGTMNTADRSVGHIDYAIRRRFAFVDVNPSISVINDVVKDEVLREKASNLFLAVSKLFTKDYLSSDFEPKDVQLGHSYFLATKEEDLKLKLEYEIKPLLREYVKDGILSEGAKEIIEKELNV